MDRVSVDPAIRFGKPCVAGVRFLLDQDVYAVTARLLEELGHDIALAGKLGLAQAEDEALLEAAQQQGRKASRLRSHLGSDIAQGK